ncbi:AAA-12 domain-containing protein [Fusarium keratoplasticum]|nr:AAA-12 domain-containing protein [Fusarium keratoplasticum]
MDVLSKVPLGILPIVGFAGSSKTDLMATTILLAMGVGPVIVCTPTHAAASNIAARVNKLASLAYGKVKEPIPVVVRGFSWKVDELRGKTYALGGGLVDATHDNWEHPLSMVDWMQRVLRPENLKPGIVKPASYELAKDVEKDTKIMNLKDTLHNQKGWTVAHSQAFRDLATRILEVADTVRCTTHASTKRILADWARDKAQSTFLGEAGAISMPEALVPWFNGRPLVLAGDVRQLPPCVMNLGRKSWTGGPLNFFDKHQEISRQNRIVNGGLDLAREIFYPELGDKFEYGDQWAVSKRPGASQLESWVRRRFPEIKPSPTGKIWPVFIDCLHTVMRTIDTSRVNYGQAKIALALMETLIKA